jgi:hypothetical protein
MTNMKRKTLPCDQSDGLLLLGMTLGEIQRQDEAVKQVIRESIQILPHL